MKIVNKLFSQKNIGIVVLIMAIISSFLIPENGSGFIVVYSFLITVFIAHLSMIIKDQLKDKKVVINLSSSKLLLLLLTGGVSILFETKFWIVIFEKISSYGVAKVSTIISNLDMGRLSSLQLTLASIVNVYLLFIVVYTFVAIKFGIFVVASNNEAISRVAKVFGIKVLTEKETEKLLAFQAEKKLLVSEKIVTRDYVVENKIDSNVNSDELLLIRKLEFQPPHF